MNKYLFLSFIIFGSSLNIFSSDHKANLAGPSLNWWILEQLVIQKAKRDFSVIQNASVKILRSSGSSLSREDSLDLFAIFRTVYSGEDNFKSKFNKFITENGGLANLTIYENNTSSDTTLGLWYVELSACNGNSTKIRI